MTDQERIAALEKDVEELRAHLLLALDDISRLNGKRRAYDAATEALVLHQASSGLHAQLGRRLLAVSAAMMPVEHPEFHVQAYQDAEKALLAAARSQS